jgi:hypothetical protein
MPLLTTENRISSSMSIPTCLKPLAASLTFSALVLLCGCSQPSDISPNSNLTASIEGLQEAAADVAQRLHDLEGKVIEMEEAQASLEVELKEVKAELSEAVRENSRLLKPLMTEGAIVLASNSQDESSSTLKLTPYGVSLSGPNGSAYLSSSSLSLNKSDGTISTINASGVRTGFVDLSKSGGPALLLEPGSIFIRDGIEDGDEVWLRPSSISLSGESNAQLAPSGFSIWDQTSRAIISTDSLLFMESNAQRSARLNYDSGLELTFGTSRFSLGEKLWLFSQLSPEGNTSIEDRDFFSLGFTSNGMGALLSGPSGSVSLSNGPSIQAYHGPRPNNQLLFSVEEQNGSAAVLTFSKARQMLMALHNVFDVIEIYHGK